MALLRDSWHAFYQLLAQILRTVSFCITCVPILKTKKQTGWWLCYLAYVVMFMDQMTTDMMLFILETVALSQQHPSTVVRIAVLFLTWTGFGKSGYCCLTSFRGQGMLLLEARGMTWRTKGVDYLLHLEHSFCGAPFLYDPARPGPLRMKSQTEITELAKASPQSAFLQTTHIHVWVEGGKSGKSDSSEELFSPSRSWSVMTRECNS